MRIVYIDIDSLRPDHMGCYGYPRNTTPNIDRIAAAGTRFNMAYCAGSPCVPSRASFISGRFAINHGALTHWGPGGRFFHPEGETYSQRYPFLTRYLRQAGYRTITFSSFADRHLAWWFNAGWDEAHSNSLKRGNEDADEINAFLIPWIQAHGKDENYFLHVQYWDPHGFYTYPDEYMHQFADQPLSDFPSAETIAAHREMSHPRSAALFHWSLKWKIPHKMPLEIRNRDDYKLLIDGYDGGISYMDLHVGQILDAYRALGIEDEVCFIITADHGESFGEQGIYMEHGMASETVNHVPLIVKIPSLGHQPSESNELVYNVDVVATLARLVGQEIPAGWDGQSLLPVLKGEAGPCRSHLVLEHGLYACQRSVRTHRWHMMRTYHPGFYDIEPVVLYDMASDPHEERNVAAEHPDLVRQLDQHIVEWVGENQARHGFIPDPMAEIVQTGPYRYLTPPEWVERLREAGRESAAQALLASQKSVL